MPEIRAYTDRQTQAGAAGYPGCLAQWPCKIRLVPVYAPYFDGADLLIAADCAAYACGNFHGDFMKDKITLIACPHEGGGWEEKLARILLENRIKSVTAVRMETPCCGGTERAVRRALQQSGKDIPLQVVTLSTDGKILF